MHYFGTKIIKIFKKTMLSEENESKTKRIATRRYREEYIEYGFVKYGNDDKKPQAICVVCNMTYTNSSLRFGRLRKHLHTWHPEIKHKDGVFFAGYLDDNQYVSDEENIKNETDPQPSYVQHTFYQTQNVCRCGLKRPYLTDSLPEPKVPKSDDVVCDIYGTYVAEKLQVSPRAQRMLAERLINELLFLANLGKLTEFHSVTCNNISYQVTDEKKHTIATKKSTPDTDKAARNEAIDTASTTNVKSKVKRKKIAEKPPPKVNTITNIETDDTNYILVNDQRIYLQKGMDDSNIVIINGQCVNMNNVVTHTVTTVPVERMTSEDEEAEITIKEEPIIVKKEPVIVKNEPFEDCGS